jgi:hypothetical protein
MPKCLGFLVCEHVAPGLVLEEARSDHMNLTDDNSPDDPRPSTSSTSAALRGRDRRRGLAQLLATLSRAVATGDPGLLRGAFEEAVKRLVVVRSLHLRDAAARWPPRTSDDRGAKALALDVPGGSPKTRGVLEATFDPACRLGAWDLQLLGMAAHLGTLILELERSRPQAARPDSIGAAGPRRDGAAPLIGSAPAMKALRSQIERVAVTDFTVLVEGESGVGKELVARQIHELSPRRNGPFVAINCAALVETLLEAELFGIEERTATGVRGRRGNAVSR